jgi:hypothetical protein
MVSCSNTVVTTGWDALNLAIGPGCPMQVSFMVGYGLDYCFEDTPAPGDPAAAVAARRPAPARPAIDTLHVFGASAVAEGAAAAPVPSVVCGGEMPLMLRQMVAREVMAERARRAEQVGRPGSGVWCAVGRKRQCAGGGA